MLEDNQKSPELTTDEADKTGIGGLGKVDSGGLGRTCNVGEPRKRFFMQPEEILVSYHVTD